MGDQIVIRPAAGEDLDGIVEVGRITWPAAYSEVMEPELVQLLLDKRWTREALIPAIRLGHCYVGCDGQRVVGMASVGRHEGRAIIWRLYVLPSHQGKHVGSRLLQAALSAIDEGTLEVFLSTTDGNAGALAFAARHHFHPSWREHQAGFPDLLWMRRDLTQDPVMA